MLEPDPQRRDAIRNRELLLDAAASLAARGVNATVAGVAAEAGLSRATGYRHFADMDAVQAALMSEVTDLIGRLISQPAEQKGSPFHERIRALIRIGLPIRTRYGRAMAKEPTPDAAIATAIGPMLTEMVREAQAGREVRSDLDAEIMGDALFVLGFYVARRVYRDGLLIEDAVQVFDTFVRGMVPAGRAG